MNKRQFDILNRLVYEEEPITGKELAKTYLVSTKTIYNDIVVLNDFLKPYSSEIVKKPSAGIFLVLDDAHRHQLMDLFQVKMESTVIQDEFKIMATFLVKNEIDILDWSLENFTSESSTKRELNEFEKELNSNGITVKKRNGKLILSGQETVIRQFFRNKLLSGEPHTNLEQVIHIDCVSNGRIQELNHIMNHYLKQYQFSVTHDYRHYLLLDLLIFDIRWRRGNKINQTPRVDGNHPKVIETYLLARDLLNAIAQKEVEESEIVALSQVLISRGSYESAYLVSNTNIENTMNEFI